MVSFPDLFGGPGFINTVCFPRTTGVIFQAGCTRIANSSAAPLKVSRWNDAHDGIHATKFHTDSISASAFIRMCNNEPFCEIFPIG